jgi:hypothetical protein
LIEFEKGNVKGLWKRNVNKRERERKIEREKEREVKKGGKGKRRKGKGKGNRMEKGKGEMERERKSKRGREGKKREREKLFCSVRSLTFFFFLRFSLHFKSSIFSLLLTCLHLFFMFLFSANNASFSKNHDHKQK